MSKNFTPNSTINATPENGSGSEFIGNFFAVLLFSAAVIGLFLICSKFSGNSSDYEITEFKEKTRTNISSVLVNKVQRVNQSPSQTEEEMTRYQTLSVDGFAEVGNDLAFTIETYSPHAEYSINFGNGVFHQVNDKTTLHQYRKVGKYDVQVKINYHGKSKIISQRTIQVANAIQMKAKVTEMEW